MSEWNLIVGMDLSAEGQAAFGMALDMALAMNGAENAVHVHLAHAITEDDMDSSGDLLARRDEAMQELPAKIWDLVAQEMKSREIEAGQVNTSLHVRIGKPTDVVRQVAVDYEGSLVIVGSRNPTGLERLVMGSVAQSLVRDGRFPVLVAHPNLLNTLEKTVMPDEERPGETESVRPAAPHLYRSTLVAAWSALGRPTGNF